MVQSSVRASEILDMAIRIEERGISFYQSCVEADLGAEFEKVFMYLMEQERKHADVFSRMKEGLEDFTLPESSAKEMGGHMAAFGEEKVFDPPQKAARKLSELSDPLQAVRWAIAFEGRSIAFYASAKKIVPPSDKGVVDRIIAEERTHIRRLVDLTRKLKSEV